MDKSYETLNMVLDSITENIVVINQTGEIQYVNKSWLKFGKSNACNIGDDWASVNYIDECDKAAAMEDEYGRNAAIGIKNVINKSIPFFYLEYPCHSPNEKRWFIMRVTPLQSSQKNYFVISHQNISERKIIEEKIEHLARIDGLTGIANRRTFDEFLHDEWTRCAKIKKPISLAMIDLDHFKLLNDTYGHQYGDECLVRISALLTEFNNRPGDICARYGGEEFVFVWGGTPLDQAKLLTTKLLHEINKLNISNNNSPTGNHLTASIGLAEMLPEKDHRENELIGKADNKLYIAKKSGRNQIKS
jgi:diguanylate cyclase (GGDEF)-like protein